MTIYNYLQLSIIVYYNLLFSTSAVIPKSIKDRVYIYVYINHQDS